MLPEQDTSVPQPRFAFPQDDLQTAVDTMRSYRAHLTDDHNAYKINRQDVQNTPRGTEIRFSFFTPQAKYKLGGLAVRLERPIATLILTELRTKDLIHISGGMDYAHMWLARTELFAREQRMGSIVYTQPQGRNGFAQSALLLRCGYVPQTMLRPEWGVMRDVTEAAEWRRRFRDQPVPSDELLRSFAETENGRRALFRTAASWRLALA